MLAAIFRFNQDTLLMFGVFMLFVVGFYILGFVWNGMSVPTAWLKERGYQALVACLVAFLFFSAAAAESAIYQSHQKEDATTRQINNDLHSEGFALAYLDYSTPEANDNSRSAGVLVGKKRCVVVLDIAKSPADGRWHPYFASSSQRVYLNAADLAPLNALCG
jgi:hypothetical protein